MVRISPLVTRTASPSYGLASLLAVALLVLAAGPAVATVADALRNGCCHESCPPPEAPASGDAPSCCFEAPAASHDVATSPSPPAHDGALMALVTDTAVPRATPRAQTPPRDTGPPAGPRRHLALSVFLI